MKIKVDFVTNSSSTSYVVFIPDKFKVTRNEAKSIYQNGYYGQQDAEFDDETFEDIERTIEELKNGEVLWTYGDDEGTPAEVYYTALEICNTHQFIVADSEMGGEGNNSIFGIRQKNVVDILKTNIDLTNLLTTISKGVELCCETKKVSR